MENKLKWTARILAIIILLFGLPFYFGYGNPLPLINPNYTILDNIWLTIFPLMFLGLILGWKYQKIGGYLITIPLAIGLIITSIIEKEFIWFMLVPFIVGILYILSARKKSSKTKKKKKSIRKK